MKTQAENLKSDLEQLKADINASGENCIELHQQQIKKENLSFSGGDGRIYIQPTSEGYDISLAGESLERRMLDFMNALCGKEPDGHKQTKPEPHQPFWRVSDFSLVEKAVRQYSKTRA